MQRDCDRRSPFTPTMKTPMDASQYNAHLFEFLSSSVSPFHAVAGMEAALIAHGFSRLEENERWQLEQGRSYFLSKSQAALIAFILGREESAEDGFRILAAHTDSPCLKIKPRADYCSGSFQQLGIEVYGGALLPTWFDRDLSLAGRVCCLQSDGRIGLFLVNFRRPLLTIPSLAIHFDREANKHSSINQQQHLPPLLGVQGKGDSSDFTSLLLAQIHQEHPHASITEVLAFDLFCYDSLQPAYIGRNEEMISAARLDNLLSCHAGLTAVSRAEKQKNVMLFCANHEEIGSTSNSGAQSSLLDGLFERLCTDNQSRRIALSNSFMVSMDNAHATHPNHLDKTDPRHEISLNKGPVIKYNANQRYATDAASAAIFKAICRHAGISPQEFVMRSDLPCGSTIGPMTSARLGVATVDIGAPSLAMHSIRELTGAYDPSLLFTAIGHFLATDLHKSRAV